MNTETSPPPVWSADASRAIEQETIYLRERLRARAEALVRDAGRGEVTLADVDQARRMSGHAPVAPCAICTLPSETLVDDLARRRPAVVFFNDTAFTENFGVEKVVANLVAN